MRKKSCKNCHYFGQYTGWCFKLKAFPADFIPCPEYLSMSREEILMDGINIKEIIY